MHPWREKEKRKKKDRPKEVKQKCLNWGGGERDREGGTS